jgi:N-dimethylarginine dimethylaminohydrolase
MTVMAILMCRPDYFGVEYEINPWMHVQVSVDHPRAMEQWESLKGIYESLGVELTFTEPHKGLPDMVFSANAAVLWDGKAVLSNFHHPQRQGEEGYWRAALEGLNFEVHELPRSVSFEGAGDALFVGNRLFIASGFRTDHAAHAPVAEILGVEAVSLELVDPRFYHLDTCFCPLDERTVLYAHEAFSAESAEMIRRHVPHVIPVPLDVAAGFACNAMPIGDRVISSLAACKLEEPLAAAGFSVIALPMSEFMKAGGGVRCLSLPLEAGRS